MPGTPEEAVSRGLAHLAAGAPREAVRWFDRARRLAPEDASAALLLASALSGIDPQAAEDLLRPLVAQHPGFGAAVAALSAIRLARDDAAEAASLLQSFLAACAPPPDTGFADLAARVAAQAGYPGWIGVDAGGRVTLHMVGPGPVLLLDGRPVALRRSVRGMALPPAWLGARSLTATCGALPLLGSPVRLMTRRAATGQVEADGAGGLHGWAWIPADPDATPRLCVTGARGAAPVSIVARAQGVSDGVSRPRHFQVPAHRLPPGRHMRVTGPDGADLPGSPLRVLAGGAAASTPAPGDTQAAPLRAAEVLRWRRGARAQGAVVLITHAQGGGVARHVQARAAALSAQGLRPIILTPHGAWPPEPGAPRPCALADGDGPFPLLVWDPARALGRLAAFLLPEKPQAVELHHLMGHDFAITGLATRLGVPMDVVLHDYALICPRVTLCGGGARYCGEPAEVSACDACVAEHGDRLHEAIGVAALRARSATLIAQARHVHAPTGDSARRVARYLPSAGKTLILPWEDKIPPALPAAAAAPFGRHVCVVGAIGEDKGYGVLLACAEDAARRGLDLHFTVVGHTTDDARLMQTGRVFVTGRYAEDEALALIARARPDLGFLPSVWPETWCYSLSLLWRAGLWPVVFDFGAQAARVTACGIGTRLPPGLPADRINDVLLRTTPRAA